MSRRAPEFAKRTVIFEGAYRAWSHLGGLEPEELETKEAMELDPSSGPIENDPRQNFERRKGSRMRTYPYEPLPRHGLAHPYVEAILSPWLGPDAEENEILRGLSTLRTWWQHRRKGENKTSLSALGTKEMKHVLDRYTKHFFSLAHHFVVHDKELPPLSLQTKIEQKKGPASDFSNNDSSPKESTTEPSPVRQQSVDKLPSLRAHGDPALSPLELFHADQLSHLRDSRGGNSSIPQFHTTTPLVFVSGNQVSQILLTVDGIASDYCVRIVEAVLKGCDQRKPPIDGLLDATADRESRSVLIRIDRARNAKRIAFEAMGKLAIVGYPAKVKELVRNTDMDWGLISTAFEGVANTDRVFNWTAPCKCPDDCVRKEECARHSQMSERIFQAFNSRCKVVAQLMTESGMKCVTPFKTEATVRQGIEPITKVSNMQGFQGRNMNFGPSVDSFCAEGPNAPPGLIPSLSLAAPSPPANTFHNHWR